MANRFSVLESRKQACDQINRMFPELNISVEFNEDLNIIDDKDKVVVGNSQPRLTGGFNANLRYKSFSINTNFSFTIKRDIINKALADRFAAYGNPLSKDLNIWRRCKCYSH